MARFASRHHPQGTQRPTAAMPSRKKSSSANTMWGGRFDVGVADVMARINASIDVDMRLYAEDIAGSLAHAAMLADRGIISRRDHAAIRKGLAKVKVEIETGRFTFKAALEDIHMNVESRLGELIGPAAGRLHTCLLYTSDAADE